MQSISDDLLASITFQLEWEKNAIRFTDLLHAPRVNLWRDLLREPLKEQLAGRRTGDKVVVTFPPGRVTGGRSAGKVYRLPRRRVEGSLNSGETVIPRYGRFYPAGVLRGLPGIFRGSVIPFRCVDVDDNTIMADFNHPLTEVPLTISAVVEEVRDKFEERGGTCQDWLETLTTGPGFQARINGRSTDFLVPGALDREDSVDDTVFYQQPRMVQHIDDAAIAAVTDLYRRRLSPGARVLDLMSSWTSHLPPEIDFTEVAGLGLNAEELAANPRLSQRVVHDLNTDPRLPFETGRFDAVICTVSVEYLTDPLAIFNEVARVLRPGGVFTVTFSNRWFAPKAIRIWSELHEFERPGLVLEYFLHGKAFKNLHAFSLRGRPRPENDKYYGQNRVSDPVFAVWGSRV
ncbi:MAG: methyltransferase domain-containing protein [Desulfobacterales bacterium]|jgi:FKBP-type peptidyl-prolyl cis-trans isomerase 2|nr:methyltransferase domain-containing protein [Desulfobacterales bacterium]